jgi:hypothetical protein
MSGTQEIRDELEKIAGEPTMHSGVTDITGTPTSTYQDVNGGRETIVPRTTHTGGIEGSDDPYGDIVYREGGAGGATKILSNIKKRPVAAATTPVTPQPSVEDELPDISDIEAQIAHLQEQAQILSGGFVKESPSALEPIVQQPQAPIPVVTPPVVDPALMNTLKNLQENQNLLMETLAKKEQVEQQEKQAKQNSLLTVFSGSFGEITGHYEDIIDGEHCIALIIDTTGRVCTYEPPVSRESSFTMIWDDKKILVSNIGMTFMLESDLKVLILIKS